MSRAVPSVFCGILVGLALCVSQAQAAAPQSIVGVRLGSQIEEIKDMVDLGSAVPLWGSQYLMRAPLRPARGYQSGYVVYGNCARKGRVVRVKLTYEDDSQAFYNKLHSAITKRYGKPTEWRGNPFGTLRIWKWSLRDSEGKRVSIILQHYVGDDDSFTPGNSIRLTNSSFIDEETACYREKRQEQKAETHPALMPEKIDIEWFLPQ
ncbi:MAG: hypothetical protein MUC41_04620 [Syntrophobacteraceae bacterium]|jgi:hypothetical protein|nr:hypothetical protein [Syntrophobacteraceae bacterium]